MSCGHRSVGDCTIACRSAAYTGSGAADIAAERARQVAVEGWDAKHDDEHDDCALAGVAAVLVADHVAKLSPGAAIYLAVDGMPVHEDSFGLLAKHKDPRRRLVIAGALIAAEIDRLDRAKAAAGGAEVERLAERLHTIAEAARRTTFEGLYREGDFGANPALIPSENLRVALVALLAALRAEKPQAGATTVVDKAAWMAAIDRHHALANAVRELADNSYVRPNALRDFECIVRKERLAALVDLASRWPTEPKAVADAFRRAAEKPQGEPPAAGGGA